MFAGDTAYWRLKLFLLKEIMSTIPIKTLPCPLCHETRVYMVQQVDFDRWQREEVLIQDAFPYLSEDERNLIIDGGLCPECRQRVDEKSKASNNT